MERGFERAKAAAEGLFWDWCIVEGFTEEETEWGERLHERQEGEGFPCRLVETAEPGGADGLLARTERQATLLYPAGREVPAGSWLRVRLENGEERLYIAAGESRCFRTHKEAGVRRRGTV